MLSYWPATTKSHTRDLGIDAWLCACLAHTHTVHCCHGRGGVPAGRRRQQQSAGAANACIWADAFRKLDAHTRAHGSLGPSVLGLQAFNAAPSGSLGQPTLAPIGHIGIATARDGVEKGCIFSCYAVLVVLAVPAVPLLWPFQPLPCCSGVSGRSGGYYTVLLLPRCTGCVGLVM